jgi:hypothetical protein
MMNGVPHTDQRRLTSRPTGRGRAWARFGIGALWGAVMLVFFATVVFTSMVGTAYLAEKALPARLAGYHVDEIVEVAAVISGIAAVMVCRRARMWWLRARLRGLRRHGVHAMAKVTRRDLVHTVNPRGPNATTYTVSVHWQEATGERCYRFWAPGSADFLKRTESGRVVPVYYPPGRPHKFLIDIPYAPTIADFFL